MNPTDTDLPPAAAGEDYTTYCRPKTGRILAALGLDVNYHRAEGDQLFYRDSAGEERAVLDFLGGYGAGLFGHNHPALVARARELLDQRAPFNAQASCRALAGQLGRALSERVGRATGGQYVVTLANSGTEATEAAIKHSELAHQSRLRAIQKKVARQRAKIESELQKGRYVLAPDFQERARQLFPELPVHDCASVFAALENRNAARFNRPPLFIALRWSFHGKSSGAVQLTHHEDYRLPFKRLGPQVAFVEAGDLSALTDHIDASQLHYLAFTVSGHTVSIVEQPYCNVAGLFVEPIQGEGGVRAIEADFLRACRTLADRHHFPLIFDEIQSGMGRTGTFLAAEACGVEGDYYLLAKSLGGGLSKIAAVLIRRSQYEDEFGLIHSSTFAEDDYSAGIALRALQLLDEDQLMARCADTGADLRERLLALQQRYPSIIKDVRGRGLFLGVQIADLTHSGSCTLTMLSDQGYLGYIIAGYLLHEHGIRVAPTLSHAATIRIEPSAYISPDACNQLVAALDRLCELLHKRNLYPLVRYIVGAEQPGETPPIADYRAEREPYRRPRHAKSVAFIAHFISPDDVVHWDPSLAPFSSEQRRQLLDKVGALAGPVLYEQRTVHSITGDRVTLNFIGLCQDSSTFYRQMARRDVGELRAMIDDAVTLAVETGSTMVGFGGYSSIVTNNCRAVYAPNTGLTTGNSLTVAMGVEALRQSARDRSIDLDSACFGAVGAAGNIASVFSQLMAEDVPRLILFGRPGGEQALVRSAAEIYFEVLKTILYREQQGIALHGVAKVIAGSQSVARERDNYPNTPELGQRLYDGIAAEMGEAAPITVCTDLDQLRQCELILGASNAPQAVITRERLGEGRRVICDISVPEDVAEDVADNNVEVIKGGIVKLPLDADFVIPGMPLEPGYAFACMSETLLLGLSGIHEHFSYGNINKIQVKKIAQLAAMHGFTLARPKRERSY